jgi:hypothetical protein
MQDDISEAVLANEDVVKYLRGGYGDSSAQAREKITTYLEELRTTQRHKFYRALQHPLYPILRKIERKHENLHHVTNAAAATASFIRRTTRATATTWWNRWCSTTTTCGRR